MKVESAAYKVIQETPVLELLVSDPKFGKQKAYVWDVNYQHLKRGFVALYDATDFSWEKALKPIEDRESGAIIQGVTNDPTIIGLATDFWNAINNYDGKTFQTGKVRIPAC